MDDKDLEMTVMELFSVFSPFFYVRDGHESHLAYMIRKANQA